MNDEKRFSSPRPDARGVHRAARRRSPFDLEVGYRWLDLKGDEEHVPHADQRAERLLDPRVHDGDRRLRGTVAPTASASTSATSAPARPDRSASKPSAPASITSASATAPPMLFSAVPAFALGQHTYDRTRRTFDADLELFPDRTIVPFLGYSFNRLSGPGTTSYHAGQDEFLLGQSVRDTEHEYRIGAGFHFANVSGSVTQGWRRFSGDETLTLTGPSTGNNTAPILGRDITATSISRHDSTRPTPSRMHT